MFYVNTKEEKYLHRRNQAVHVITAVAVVAEEQFVVVLRGAAESTGLTFDTLPGILPYTYHHIFSKL